MRVCVSVGGCMASAQKYARRAETNIFGCAGPPVTLLLTSDIADMPLGEWKRGREQNNQRQTSHTKPQSDGDNNIHCKNNDNSNCLAARCSTSHIFFLVALLLLLNVFMRKAKWKLFECDYRCHCCTAHLLSYVYICTYTQNSFRINFTLVTNVIVVGVIYYKAILLLLLHFIHANTSTFAHVQLKTVKSNAVIVPENSPLTAGTLFTRTLPHLTDNILLAKNYCINFVH